MIGAYLVVAVSHLGSLWLAIPANILSVLLRLLLEWLLVGTCTRPPGRCCLTYGDPGIRTAQPHMRNDVQRHGARIFSASIPLTETLSYPVYRLFMSAVCIVLAALLAFVIRRTRLGMMIRAGASNRDMAQSLGINIGLLYRIVFALGVALAALAGMVAAPVSSVFPGMGSQVLIVCFVVVVIGGIGSVKGALAAALLIGLVDTFGKVVELHIGTVKLLPELSGMSVYLLMAVVLLWRPQGLFGTRP
jgi:branched-chain amino acid transport system permease protein